MCARGSSPATGDFAAKAARALDLCQRRFEGKRLEAGEFVVSAGEKTSIQARWGCHPSLPAGKARMLRVEHEYGRGGALACLAAWGVGQAEVFGRCGGTTGIVPFGRLVEQVMTVEPYASAKRVFWVVGNGSSRRGKASIERLEGEWSNLRLIRLPARASWLNQIEICFSVVQRRALAPDDFAGLDAAAARLLAFQTPYEQTAKPSSGIHPK